MATNKFATMLHRNTNKVVVILVYAVLEWVLILLLLLNSLFSYLISRFAKWVGLQPPCLWCSRVDHILQQGNDKKISNLDKDLLCEAHASEISKLGYCSNHRKLSEANTMCEDCLASRPNHYHEENSIGMRHRIAFISWVSHEQQHVENVENSDNTIEKCSCCNENLRSQFYPPYLLLKPSWGDDGNYTSKGSLIVESIDDDDDDKEGDKELEFERNNHDHDGEHHILSDIESFILREVAEDRSSSVSNLHSDEKDAEKDEIHEKEEDLIITEVDPSGSNMFIGGFDDNSTKEASLWEDRSLEFIDMHFESNAARDSNRLIPVMFIDSVTSMQFQSWKIDEDLREKEQEIETLVIEAQSSCLEGEALFKSDNNEEKTSIGEFEDYDTSMPTLENSIVMEFEELQMDLATAKVHPERITIEDDQFLLNDDDKNVEAFLEEQDKTQADLPLLSREPICSYESTKEDESSTDEESSTSDDDAEVHNAFEAFISQNNLNKSQSQCNDDESLKSDDDEDDDDTEVQNAFEEFIAQNNLSKSQSLCNGDNNIEADMEEPKPDNTQIEPACSCQCIEEDQSSESEDDTDAANAFDKFIAQNNLRPDKTDANDNDDAEMIEEKNSVEKYNEEISHQSSKGSDSYEAEEEKLPETPTSSDGMHYLQRKLMLFDKRESGAEDSVDGSVASELEYSDPSSTIEKLKTSLKSERKALTAIYQELEEERSASAVAANQTMAMITRLQEEKAAMQMEALQYQRMMEEQAEYDQEALQLLNELMLKREKEKEELEKELEEYRQKVMDYEAKEKLRVLRRMKGSCSDSCSSDDLSIDLNRGVTRDEENGFLDNEEINIINNNNNNNINASNSDTVSNLEDMAMDCVKHISALDDSLAEFEEERASILDQLRELEEKIMCLEDTEEFMGDTGTKLDENSSEYAEKNYSSPEDNIMHPNNGFSDDNNTKHATRRSTTFGSLAKRLLPYLDAAENATEEEEAIACTFDTTTTMEFEPESVSTALIEECDDNSMMKVSIEEEVDRVYERLQALETDREFLQHCVGSIQNGDKGMDLLQEILQHLRDLKSVELRLKNLGSDQVE